MQYKETLIENIDKVHTTEMGIGRISKNITMPCILLMSARLSKKDIPNLIISF